MPTSIRKSWKAFRDCLGEDSSLTPSQSRQHAEIWCEDGKIFIKDVKSSNGTFINGDRLSPESAESEPFELHSEDVVVRGSSPVVAPAHSEQEFGIDIVSDDNKTIVHHKVSTKVYVVINADEAMAMLKCACLLLPRL